MAIAQLEFPRFKAFTTTGKLLSGGKVYVYDAGTSTKVNIWQDADKNSLHTNPVTLDSNGEAEIWFEGPVKVVLEDSNGVQQWTMDDIESDIPPVDVGRFNQVENGSFEIDTDANNLPDGWDIVEFDSTSTVEIDQTTVVHGSNSLKFVSQGAGGGTATTSDLFLVTSGGTTTVSFSIRSTVADVQNSVSVRWFDKDQTFISSSTVYNENTNNPTSFEEKRFTAQAPATATFAKLRLVGCDSADATPGTTYFDNVKVYTDNQAAVYSTNDVWEFSGIGGEVTATAAELNKMDGYTGTTADLNNLDGYTGGTANLNNISGLSVDISGINAYPFNAGDIAANAVGQSEIAAGAVGRSELKTATTTETLSSSATTSVRNTAAGPWGFGFQSRFDFNEVSGDPYTMGVLVGYTDSPTQWTHTRSSVADTGMGSFVTLNTGTAFSTAYFEIRYFQSSPPYDMGDGECGLFISVDLDSNGNLIGTSISPDPMWANNGPTDIRPDYTDKNTGKKYKRTKRPQLTREDLEAGRCDMDELIAANREAPVEDAEITCEYKNSDMHLYPHSWVSHPKGTICMLDPVQTHGLLMLQEDGEDISELLRKGFILPGDEVSRYGPPGVKMISFKWKRTKN